MPEPVAIAPRPPRETLQQFVRSARSRVEPGGSLVESTGQRRSAACGRQLLLIACGVLLPACVPPSAARSGAHAPPQTPHSFVTEDVVRFIGALEALPEVADTAAFLDSAYVAKGSAGLQSYARRYPLSGKGLASAIRRHPADYAGLPARLRWLETRFDSLGALLERYRAIYPAMVDKPVYFVVGERGGINSGSEVGPLLNLETGAATPENSRLDEVLAHEVTHIQQASAVGIPRYVTLYTTRPSLLGVVMREGVAEFMAELVAGGVTLRRAQEYFTAREDEVWREFVAQICDTSPGEWASGSSRDPSRPILLGYAVGAAVARSYYEGADDKAAALRTMLTSDDYATMFLESGYAEKRGNADEVRAALRGCGRP